MDDLGGFKPTIFGNTPIELPQLHIFGWAMASWEDLLRTQMAISPLVTSLVQGSRHVGKMPLFQCDKLVSTSQTFKRTFFQSETIYIWKLEKLNHMIFVWCSGNNIISPYLATRRISKLDLHFAEDPVIFWGGTLGILNRFLKNKASSSQTDHMGPRHDLLMGSYAALLLHRCSGRHCEKWRCTMDGFPPPGKLWTGT